METYYRAKHWLKRWRWQVRRMLTALRWGPKSLIQAPIVFANAMPKSGSHLIFQVLQGLPQIGPFINPGFPPVNRDENNRKLHREEILANLRYLRPGDISYGYVHAEPLFVEILTRPGWATVFIFRDPRDVIVSHVFYATEIHKEHGMHKYYTMVLESMEERINAQILGVEEPGSELSPVRTKYAAYLGWLDQPDVLCLSFEDLILDRDNTLSRLLCYLSERGYTSNVPRTQEVEILKNSIAPHKSGTFRKGKPGNWREHFTPRNIAVFKEATGDLLIRLGYERDNNW